MTPVQANPDRILSAAAVRERCGIVFTAAERGEAPHFHLHLDRLDDAAALVVETTRRRYPDLRVPFHSRWRHFAVGGKRQLSIVHSGVFTAVHLVTSSKSGQTMCAGRSSEP